MWSLFSWLRFSFSRNIITLQSTNWGCSNRPVGRRTEGKPTKQVSQAQNSFLSAALISLQPGAPFGIQARREGQTRGYEFVPLVPPKWFYNCINPGCFLDVPPRCRPTSACQTWQMIDGHISHTHTPVVHICMPADYFCMHLCHITWWLIFFQMGKETEKIKRSKAKKSIAFAICSISPHLLKIAQISDLDSKCCQ